MQIDFIQLCKDYGIEYQASDNWVNVECPICHHSGTRGFKGGLSIQSGYFYCWNCGGHDITYALSKLLGVNRFEVESLLEKYSNQISLRTRMNEHHAKKIKLPIDTLDDRCKRYLSKRNYDPIEIEKKYKVVGATFTGDWVGRLIIPIYYKNKLVSFQGRSLLGKEKCAELNILRYKTLSKNKSVIDPKTILYNLDNCTGKSVLLFEGAFDVWRFGDNAVATLGTSTTQEQHILLTLFDNVFILFDPEKEAQERARKVGKQIQDLKKMHVEVIDTELDHDPGDMTDDEVAYIKKELKV